MSTGVQPGFAFTTKAGNLAQLQGRLATARVMPQETVRVGTWRLHREDCVRGLQHRFSDERLIMRSSAPGEDSVSASMAGAFESILNVASSDPAAVARAIDAVEESYAARRGSAIDGYEVLVQPMVPRVRASGVVFTRDLDKGGPYYLLNYDDETDHTDSVTAGNASTHKVVRIFKGVDAARLDSPLRAIVLMARELEQVTGCDAIDIEFAIDADGVVFVLQVRPLARTRIVSYVALDKLVTTELNEAIDFVREKFGRHPQLFGRTTVFGEMPDWNPAEIIGTQPKPLATSLYSYIIMKSVWREARNLVGYRHPFPCQLLVEVAGRPYVDVRCSFNSFLPATLRPALAEKLVNHYLDRLHAHPEFHDKIEFEVVLTSLDFNFDLHSERLRDAGFIADEIVEIREALRSLTDTIATDRQGVLERLRREVQQLQPRRDAALAQPHRVAAIPILIEELLEDCIEFGTRPFSVFARCAFIGNAFLKSLIRRGVLTPAELDRYLQAIPTVASEFVEDLNHYRRGALPLRDFLQRYGHLRPGTYDICAYSYAERPDLYLGAPGAGPAAEESSAAAKKSIASAVFPSTAVPAIEALIAEYGFTFNVEALNRFIIAATQLREAVKFEFTKNLSAAMSLLVEFGEYHGLTRERLSFLPIESFLALANRNVSADWLAHARDTAERNGKRYELTGTMNLPDLIFGPADIEVISLQRRRPNFVTQKRIIARRVLLEAASLLEKDTDLSGRLVMIENADPGFDWLFARNIGGLITKYGGAASHMTIRCAELGLPAAIGCGEQIFAELSTANTILLDCAEHRIEPQ